MSMRKIKCGMDIRGLANRNFIIVMPAKNLLNKGNGEMIKVSIMRLFDRLVGTLAIVYL